MMSQRVPVINKRKSVNFEEPHNRSVDGEVSQITSSRASYERLRTEKELVHEIRSKFYGDKKLAVSSKAFKEGATPTDVAATVEMLVDITSRCFDQYFESFHKLCEAVEYIERSSEEGTEVTRSVGCSKDQEDRGETKSSEDLESSDNSITLINFKFDMDGILLDTIRNFARYCRALAFELIHFKQNFYFLPSNYSLSRYKRLRRLVLKTYYGKIQTYPSYYKLVDQLENSEKLEIFLKSSFDLLSNLVSDLPFASSENIDETIKSRAVNFLNTSRAMGTFLLKMCQPLSQVARMVKAGRKNAADYEDVLGKCLKDIFNSVRNFKTLLHGDLPYYDDLVKWARDLQKYAFELCHCKVIA